MPLSKYYKILGLPNNTSLVDVKRQYRKLVLRFHPDRNSDPNAEKVFHEITEAYNIIIGKIKIEIPAKVEEKKSNVKSKEDRIKEARIRFENQKRQEELNYERSFQKIISTKHWKRFKLIALFSALLGVLFFLESYLPCRYEKDKVIGYNLRDLLPHNKGKLLIVTKNGNKLFIENEELNFSELYSSATDIHIKQGLIFRLPFQVISRQSKEVVYYPVVFSFSQANQYLFPLFLFPLFLVFYKRKNAFFMLFFYLTYIIVPVIWLIILLTDNRLLHLLTLGNF